MVSGGILQIGFDGWGEDFSACNLLDQTNRALANQEINRFVNEYLTPNELLTDSDKFYIHLYILNYNQCKYPRTCEIEMLNFRLQSNYRRILSTY